MQILPYLVQFPDSSWKKVLQSNKKCFSALCCASVTRGFCCVWSERLDADDWLNGWWGGGQNWSSQICLDLNFPLFFLGGGVKVGQVKSA